MKDFQKMREYVQSVKMLLKMNTMFYVSALYILILERTTMNF